MPDSNDIGIDTRICASQFSNSLSNWESQSHSWSFQTWYITNIEEELKYLILKISL